MSPPITDKLGTCESATHDCFCGVNHAHPKRPDCVDWRPTPETRIVLGTTEDIAKQLTAKDAEIARLTEERSRLIGRAQRAHDAQLAAEEKVAALEEAMTGCAVCQYRYEHPEDR